MSFAFRAKRGLVMVRAEVFGPQGSAVVQLALDTGATQTVIDPQTLVSIGYRLSQATSHIQLTTATGTPIAPIIQVSKLESLGMDRRPIHVAAHALPSGTFFDGVLGLDFFRGRVLEIDFQTGQIDLT